VALCGATPVLLAAQDAGTLRGRVVDEQRLPVAAAQVSIRPLAGDGAAVTVETTDDGTFSRGSIPSGLYTVTAGKDHWQQLMGDVSNAGDPRLTVDLEALTITRPNGDTIAFEIDAFRRDCLLNGLDDIGLTLQKADKIEAFEAAQRTQQPWLYLADGQ